MKQYAVSLIIHLLLVGLIGCNGTTNQQGATQTADSLAKIKPVKYSVPDSIDAVIATYERRLDIKMKRKQYESGKDILVTLQKWFEFGDTSRMIKLREEILTGDKRMQVTQYHIIDNKIAEIHDYDYNKVCDEAGKQCMLESKYYFAADTLYQAVHRQTTGTAINPPVVERETFVTFTPQKNVLKEQIKKMEQINRKYASLSFPKPRPEQGTSVTSGMKR